MKELRCFRHQDFSEPAKTLRHQDVLALINTGTKKLRQRFETNMLRHQLMPFWYSLFMYI